MQPKISVLIPLYNRKNFVEDCINSVLIQTFQNFEIVIRDDFSTDGAFELVQEKFSEQISSGKIKLFRNEKNLGEAKTCNRLFKDATGKYFTILHNDDFYLPHALKHLHEVAEKYHADVVHSSYYFTLPENSSETNLTCDDKRPAENILLVSKKPEERFLEFINYGTFHDAQYNLYDRNFILRNEIFFDEIEAESLFFMLQWIMSAKNFVKTPVAFYVKRDAQDSQTFVKDFFPTKFEKFISAQIEISKLTDRLFEKIDFFKNNSLAQYMAKAHILHTRYHFDIARRKIYQGGITKEIFVSAEKIFKENFGENYFYPLFLFHMANTQPFGQYPDFIKKSSK